MADKVLRRYLGRIKIDVAGVATGIRLYRLQGIVKGEAFMSFRAKGSGFDLGDSNLRRLIRSALVHALQE